MNLRSRRSDSPEVNLTPLIDVVFLMLIFFMVSTTFNREAELSIELPSADSEAGDDKPDALELTIDAEGRYYIGGQGLVNNRTDTLRRAMNKALGERSNIPLVISADARTPHQAVVTAMDVAGQLGLVHISIVARKTADTP